MEGPRHVEAKMNITVKEITFCFRNEVSLVQTSGVRHHQLKHVAASFDVDSKADRIK